MAISCHRGFSGSSFFVILESQFITELIYSKILHSGTLLYLPESKLHIHNSVKNIKTGPNTGFEFGRRYEFIKLLKHHIRQKLLQTDRLFVLCFMFRQIYLVLKSELCF